MWYLKPPETTIVPPVGKAMIVSLIEFDETIPFKLYDNTNDSALGGDVNPGSIISKITLLTLHFPQLQIIWSKGPSHTAEIFRDLRKASVLGGVSTKDPDLQKISKIGTVGEGGMTEEDIEPADSENDFKKYLPSEFLKRLPGVDSHNINKITRNVKNIVELTKMPEEEMKQIIGAKNAKELRQFLDKKLELTKSDNFEIND